MEFRSILTESKIIVEDAKPRNSAILGSFKATLANVDAVTQNKTMYSAELWKMVLESPTTKKKLAEKAFIGLLDHPEDKPETRLRESAFTITKLWEENKQIWGVCEAFNTPTGNILWTLINAGVVVQFSSRGTGEEETDYTKEGVRRIIPSSYSVYGWDAVAEASAIGSQIQSFSESKRIALTESLNKINTNMAKDIVNDINNKVKLFEKTSVATQPRSGKKMLTEAKPIAQKIIEANKQPVVEKKVTIEEVMEENKRLVENAVNKTKIIDAQKVTIDSLKAKYESMYAKNKEIETQLVESKKTANDKSKVIELENKINELTNQNKVLVEEKTMAVKQLDSKNLTVVSLKEKYEKVYNTNKVYEAELKNSKMLIEKKNSEIEYLNETKDSNNIRIELNNRPKTTEKTFLESYAKIHTRKS